MHKKFTLQLNKMKSLKFYATIVAVLLIQKFQLSISISNHKYLTPYEVILSWKILDYKFPSPQMRDEFLKTKQFIPENNPLTGIKIFGSRLFVTVPRLRAGVPSTLNYIDLKSITVKGSSPQLIPYPSWNMQKIGNCNALQFVQSMEIDRWGRMWIIDVGRDNIFGDKTVKCPAKLLIIDLATNQILHQHEFPPNVVNPQTNYLNDLVVECKTGQWGCWAYITDCWDAKLVLYSLEEDRSWYVQHSQSMTADPSAMQFHILGGTYTVNSSINGIALSPKRISNHDRLYYNPLSSRSMYSVTTSTLKHAFMTGQTKLSDLEVTCHAKNRPSQSGGTMMDSTGLLFMGQMEHNAVSYFNTTKLSSSYSLSKVDHLFEPEVVIMQDDIDLQWPDTFAFDNQGYLYLTTCRNQRFFSNTMDFNDVNFRVVRVFVGSRSYMY